MLRIKEIQKAKGVSNKELAEKLSLTENAVSLIVNGKRQPRYESLADIASMLDVDIRDLFIPTKEKKGIDLYIKDENGEMKRIGELKPGDGVRLG